MVDPHLSSAGTDRCLAVKVARTANGGPVPTTDLPLPELAVERVTVRFGGLVALDDVSLDAPAGQITGLIGPNGAGKTTLFNACTGAVATGSGSIRLGERRLDGHSMARRAALGLGRTFQRMELFDSLTVEQNVALGPEALFSARRPWGQLGGSRKERQEIAALTAISLERCGLVSLASKTVGNLSTGQRRLVELARATASSFRFLLLDEPSSGLDVSETENFAQILLEYVDETGLGVLLVEHDMALVSEVCSYMWVLDFGRLICAGPAGEVLQSPTVQAAYLGSETLDLDADMSADAHSSAQEELRRV